jgi:hypothetical protein
MRTSGKLPDDGGAPIADWGVAADLDEIFGKVTGFGLGHAFSRQAPGGF